MTSLIPWKKKREHVPVRQDRLSGFGTDLDPVSRFHSEFDQLIDRFWNDWGDLDMWGGSSRPGWNLEMDDEEDEYVLHAELPGFDPEEIDVSVSGNMMTIRAEHVAEKKGKNGSTKQYGHFCETFTLPRGVDADKIDARYHNGLLDVHLPKSEECKAKRIAVKSN